jgi:hypothetical protein
MDGGANDPLLHVIIELNLFSTLTTLGPITLLNW